MVKTSKKSHDKVLKMAKTYKKKVMIKFSKWPKLLKKKDK